MSLERLLGVAARVQPARSSWRWLACGAALFVAVLATAVAAGGVPPLSEISLWWLLPALLLAVVTLVLNGIEFALAGRLAGHAILTREAIRVSAMSSAANVLPIPGAALVRIQALRKREMRTGLAVALTAGVGLVWVGIGGLLAALVVAADRQLPAAAGILLFGGLSTSGGLVLLLRGSHATRRRLAGIVGFEVVATGITALRIFVIGRALVPEFDLASSACLALIGILSTAAGVFPGGLGIREALSATVSGVASVDPASAVVVSALDRLISYIVLGVVAASLMLLGDRAVTPLEVSGHESPH